MFVQARGQGSDWSVPGQGGWRNLHCVYCKLVAFVQNHNTNPSHQVWGDLGESQPQPILQSVRCAEVPESSITDLLGAGLPVVALGMGTWGHRGTGTEGHGDTGTSRAQGSEAPQWQRPGLRASPVTAPGLCRDLQPPLQEEPLRPTAIPGTTTTSGSHLKNVFQVEMLRKPRR